MGNYMDNAELSKLPYYQIKPSPGRTTVLVPFFHDGDYWIPLKHKAQLRLIKPAALFTGTYLAVEPEKPSMDLALPLFDLLMQRISSQKLIYLLQTIVNDIANFGSSFEKYFLFLQSYEGGTEVPLLVATELEFLLINVRSLYDQLQRIIRDLWNKTTLVGTSLRKQQLPISFREVILSGKRGPLRKPEEITDKYGLPEPIALFYHQQSPFFKLCRDMRDGIVHHGKSFSQEPIFHINDGVAVDTTKYPYSAFDCWDQAALRNNKLGSVLPLMAYIVGQTISATTAYTNALTSCIQLPEAIGPDWHLFFRHPFVSHLHKTDTYMKNPWIMQAD